MTRRRRLLRRQARGGIAPKRPALPEARPTNHPYPRTSEDTDSYRHGQALALAGPCVRKYRANVQPLEFAPGIGRTYHDWTIRRGAVHPIAKHLRRLPLIEQSQEPARQFRLRGIANVKANGKVAGFNLRVLRPPRISCPAGPFEPRIYIGTPSYQALA